MNEALRERIRELTSNIRLRLGRDDQEDARAFVELYNSTYARKVTPEYYRWQFFDGGDSAFCLFAEDSERTVAVYGARALDFHARTPTRVALTVDLILDPSVRGLGLMYILEEEMARVATEHGCAALYASPNDDAMRPRIRELGWTPLPARVQYEGPTATNREAPGLVFRRVQRFGSDTAQLDLPFSLLDSAAVTPGRTPEYLDWRFSRNPVYHYALLEARLPNSGLLIGYAAVKRFEDPVTGAVYGDVVDLRWLPRSREDDPPAVEAILARALGELQEMGITTAALWADVDTVLAGAATRLGLRPTQRHRHLCCLALRVDVRSRLEDAPWRIAMADTELF